jgi:NB-ARC domain
MEVATATTTLRSASPVEFHGPAGVGKTKLLHHLAHDRLTSAFSDGVVYFSAIRHKPVEDLLLHLFDAFYEREATYKSTPVQIRRALQNERALIVLDDVDLERDDVATLMNAAPNCTFLLASTECCLWGDGRALALQGLPPDDALALVERELGRLLTREERLAAETLCAALEGHPLRLLQLAALVREDGRSLTDLAARLRIGPAAEALREQALATCSEQEQRILTVLAVPRGAGLGEQHVDALTGIADVAPVLDALQRRKLVQAHSPRYSLTGSLDETLREEWDLNPWNERALEHFADWAEQQRQAPERVAEEADAILGILR